MVCKTYIFRNFPSVMFPSILSFYGKIVHTFYKRIN